jgi:tRNA U34 5-methylaminomethyl-2-thiouridine-forming methyltransferase MnmC
MRQVIKITADGSATLFVPELNEHYHSTFGAVQESMHVFIQNGLYQKDIENLKILEVGFGTGLNALLTLLHSEFKIIEYHGIELFPLTWEMVIHLDYQNFLKLNSEQFKLFEDIHKAPWNKSCQINSGFILNKFNIPFQNFIPEVKYDLIYFDAFAPEVQPDLWDVNIFKSIYHLLNSKGILLTYCAKGIVRRAMQNCGFVVERLPGPPGKREMLRATKV